MKFDPFNWNEVKPNEKTIAQKGWLRVRFSAPSALFFEAQGVESLVGFGTSFDVEISEAVTWWADAPAKVRVFVAGRVSSSAKPEGEVFTNIDRMPGESGMLAEVTRAMRQLELEKRAMLREIRAHRDAALAEKRAPLVETLAEPAKSEAVAE